MQRTKVLRYRGPEHISAKMYYMGHNKFWLTIFQRYFQTMTTNEPLYCSLDLVFKTKEVSTLTYLLFPTWYTNLLFVYTNYIKLDSSTCFERTLPIIRRSTTSLSASDCLVQLLRNSFLSGCTRQSLAESDDTRGCICTIYFVDLLMMGRVRSKHVEESNLM